MPILRCYKALLEARSPEVAAQALDELLQLPRDTLREAMRQTPGALAHVLYRATKMYRPDGRPISSDLFEAFGPENVADLLTRDTMTASMVLSAASRTSPAVCAAIRGAAQTLTVRGRPLLDHLPLLGVGRMSARLRIFMALADQAGPAHAGAAPADRNPMHECHERLRQEPLAAAQHIRRLLQHIHQLPGAQRDSVMAQADTAIVTDILSAAAEVRPAPGVPQSARPLVGELFDALPSGALLRCVAFDPERTAHAAAMGREVSTLGRVFEASLAAGQPTCARVCEMARQHGQAPFEQVLSGGSGSQIAALIRMTALADRELGANVLMRAADHGTDPLRRLLGAPDSYDRGAFAWAAAHCGLPEHGIHQRRAMMERTRNRAADSSADWREVPDGATAARQVRSQNPGPGPSGRLAL